MGMRNQKRRRPKSTSTSPRIIPRASCKRRALRGASETHLPQVQHRDADADADALHVLVNLQQY
jgi:phosphoribosyl-AMP cyclohydrolase